MHYHARRAYVRERYRGAEGQERFSKLDPASEKRSLRHAWHHHIGYLTYHGSHRNVLLRSEGPRYEPNPSKPPRVQHPDGRVVPYTREEALGLSEHERAIGDVMAIRMELNRLLAGLDVGELRQAVELAATAFAPRSERTNLRTLRARLRWVLQRPTTNAGRAWLLAELVRRAYGDPPK